MSAQVLERVPSFLRRRLTLLSSGRGAEADDVLGLTGGAGAASSLNTVVDAAPFAAEDDVWMQRTFAQVRAAAQACSALLEGPVEPTPMPRPLSEEQVTIRSLRRAVLRAQQQGRALMVIGFVSGLVCGALLVVLYGGIGG